MSPVRVGLLGCGTVGSALARLLDDRAEVVAARRGIALEITAVAVRSTATARDTALDPTCFTTDAASIVADPDIDVIVEVIGGIEPARTLLLDALRAGKSVVTANKELVANHGRELFEAADAAGVDFAFEAAVAGGIPLIRVLRESLAGEDISRVMGIVNGTTNYVLTRMTEAGASYADALSEAQALGYAERDPTADVEGFDAGAKAAIIATLAFGSEVVAGDVWHEGIAAITTDDIEFASAMGFELKLLAVAERSPDGAIAVRVHPTMVPADHPLAAVHGSFNAIFVEGGAVGEMMLYGRGAGGAPTASAVLGDLIDVALRRLSGAPSRLGALERASIRPIDDLETAYCINVDVVDRPGVLAGVATVFGANDVSIRSMEQAGLGAEARLRFITHRAVERDVQRCLRDLASLDTVSSVGSVLRVIGDDG